MLYVRKLFTQDLRDGKQIAFPKEASYSFFSFDYINGEEDRNVRFTFRACFDQFQQYDGIEINTRLYAAGSESRMDGQVKAFIRDELNAQVDDLLIFKNKGTKNIDFDFMFVPKSNKQYYSLLLNLTNRENHSVFSFEEQTKEEIDFEGPLQQIFYGAPGTGKSHKVKELTGKDNVVRTTFHPDSDYSTFVGAYKPTTVDEPLMTVIGTKAVPVENSDGTQRTESKIVYEFVEQAFLKAYIKAWKLYAEDENNPKKQYLVIEEINRGNCAQIFGDLFQLLDRGANGFSEYPIDADKDMQKHLAKAFKDMAYLEAPAIGEMSAEETARAIRNGEKLILPSNLYVWATMNTSDQSLFPIDSAFKRRWDWQYVPIHDCNKGYRIAADTNEYDWWSFLKKINSVIGELTSSEDKKLGYFFCKADDKGIISSEKFVSKVVFYLWNEVFKDFDVDDEILNDGDSKLTFNSFYGINGNEVITRKDKVELFLTNLGVDIVNEIESQDEDNEETDSADGTTSGRDKSRYSINGEGSYKKGELVRNVAQMYVDNNSGMSTDEVIAVWRNIGVNELHFVETKAEYDARVSASKDGNSRATPIRWGDNNLMYITTQWGIGNIGIFVDCINRQNWNITINKISE